MIINRVVGRWQTNHRRVGERMKIEFGRVIIIKVKIKVIEKIKTRDRISRKKINLRLVKGRKLREGKITIKTFNNTDDIVTALKMSITAKINEMLADI